MKLRNKKTGEIDNWCIDKDVIRTCSGSIVYNSLAELNEEWEDYEEPKEHYWVIDEDGVLVCRTVGDFNNEGMCKQIGNWFETAEEAEKAVEKLKAWKRLKDKGVRICKRSHSYYGGEMFWKCPNGTGISDKQIWLDLDLLFGGEE